MSAIAEITRDQESFPTQVTVTGKRNRKLSVIYEKEGKITLRGDLDLIDVLKLIYPATQNVKNFFDDGILVYADVSVTGGVGGTTTTVYAIPINKKLFLLTANLCTDRNGVASPWSVLYMYDPLKTESLTMIEHRYTFVNTEVLVNLVGPVEKSFPAEFELRMFCDASVKVQAGFIGVLKDAGSA